MSKSARALVGALLVAALPGTSAAQAVARSFAEIQAILEPGDYVIVIDRAEQEIWGQVAVVSERTLTIATARRFTDRVEISGDRRSFAEDDVSLVDPAGNGIVIGALAGAGAGAAIASYMYATCGDTCDAPARGPTYLLSMGVCAGIGAVAGWIVDRSHKGKEVVFPVVPVVTCDRRGLTFVLRF